MKTHLYIDKGRPLISVLEHKLSDGSSVWNLHFRGGQDDHEIIPCISEKAADEAFRLMVAAVKVAIGENPLVL